MTNIRILNAFTISFIIFIYFIETLKISILTTMYAREYSHHIPWQLCFWLLWFCCIFYVRMRVRNEIALMWSLESKFRYTVSKTSWTIFTAQLVRIFWIVWNWKIFLYWIPSKNFFFSKTCNQSFYSTEMAWIFKFKLHYLQCQYKHTYLKIEQNNFYFEFEFAFTFNFIFT